MAGGAGQAHAHRVEELLVLEGEPERAGADGQVLGLAVHVLGDGHQALGTVVDRVEGRDDRQQGLRGADGDVRADGARLGQQRQGQRVGVDCHQAVAGVDGRDGTGEVLDESAAGGVGEDRPGQGRAVGGDRGGADDLDVDAQGLGPGRGHLDELGVQAGVEEHGGAGAAVRAGHE